MGNQSMRKGTSLPGPLIAALGPSRFAFLATAIFSLAINLLFLTYPLYTLQIYDRVVPSGNAMTLVMLTIIAIAALIVLGILDVVRARVLSRVGIRLERAFIEPLLEAALKRSLKDSAAATSQPIRDFDETRHLISGSALRMLFDLPWVPVYLFALFLLHPWLGLVGLAGIFSVTSLVVANELLTRRAATASNEAAMRCYSFIEVFLRNAESVGAMGMRRGLLARWNRDRQIMMAGQAATHDTTALLSGAIRAFRLILQVAALAVGAWLAGVERSASPGVIFAAAILLGRALLPIDQAINLWKPLLSGWQAWQRLSRLLEENPARRVSMRLSAPQGNIVTEKLVFIPPRTSKPALRGISLALPAGETIGIVGPSAAGKTTLARSLVGAIEPTAGTVRLDGADLRTWPPDELGKHIGYLPQDIELFPGTIVENIARFEDYDSGDVIEAARMASVHDLILSLPSGYDTYLGPDGITLSAGQMQRIGLARALYGNPVLVVLDEPNSNLDLEGEQALSAAIATLKRRGSTIIIVTHRPSLLRDVERIMLLQDGAIALFGPRDEVMERLARQTIRPVPARAEPTTVRSAS